MIALVTGSAGFLGRHMRRTLEDRGYDVYAFDIADPLNPGDALDVFRTEDRRFDLIVHCAAVAPHRAAIDHRAAAVGASNMELDAALFAWAARTRPGRIIYLSSSAAYPVVLQQGETEYTHPAWPATLPRPLTEADIDLDEPEQPDAIYGAVKLMGERLAATYRADGGHVTVLRPFSGYGDDQSPDFPFGAFRDRALRRQDPFTVWGDGSQVRDWVHVDDLVAAALAACDAGSDGPLNICTGIGTSMLDLARMFTTAAGYNPRIELHPDRPAGVPHRVGNPSALHEIYKPRVSPEEGIARALTV